VSCGCGLRDTPYSIVGKGVGPYAEPDVSVCMACAVDELAYGNHDVEGPDGTMCLGEDGDLEVAP